MADVRWIYDLTIFLYAASVLFYFNDFLLNNRKANLTAFALLAVVWLLQTVFFVSQMAAKPYFPVLTLFETLFFYSWVLVTVSLLINYFFRIDFLLFFVNVIGFVVLVLSMTVPETAPLAQMQSAVSELLFIHVTIAILSYVAFSLSLILSLMFLLQHNMLKQKKWSPLLRRLPSLDKLELFSHRMNMLGVPLLLLSIILGVIWAYLVYGGSFWLDLKVWMSLLVLVVYSVLLYRRLAEKWQGRKLVVWNVVAFSILILNVLSTNFSSFHQWL
ncbi:cytochrome C assembly family protein [Brevibacillus marinus]|uniref:cytochrome C assembly family protein n=1 Tax=Brevibacillus marinus TaxID=2496837 RepID=UPI000F82FBE8|nr:cytochrome c biogenesis protein CcsA [Brevibacillus marinus]